MSFDDNGHPAHSADPIAQADGAPDELAEDAARGPSGGLPVEPPHEARRRLEGELEALQDRHARLVAEFDNYRKRVAKERAELTERAQAGLVGKLLDVLDDLERIGASDPAATTPAALREGIAAVERKLMKELGIAGLERIDPSGTPFNPLEHEAVSTVPAPDPAQDHHVSATYQPGYRFQGHLIRPARVQVYSGGGS